MPAPIILFAYNRPNHLRRVLDALSANPLAAESDLAIYCDGPKLGEDLSSIEDVRSVAYAVKGFASVVVHSNDKNMGLAPSVIAGVSEILNKYDRVIVMEDDILVSPFFLQYINDGLDCYADNPKVASIHGWCFPHNVPNPPETFFLKGADCWGWGTWKRAWDIFEPDANTLIAEIERRGLTYDFDWNGAYNYMQMLRDTAAGTLSSWAVRWLASAYLADMYTLYPGCPLVQNIGLDGSGTNCGNDDGAYDSRIRNIPTVVRPQPVEEDKRMRRGGEAFFRGPMKQDKSCFTKIWRKLFGR